MRACEWTPSPCLEDTVKVMAKGLKQSRSGYTREKADKLYDFMKKARVRVRVRFRVTSYIIHHCALFTPHPHSSVLF